VDAGTVSRGVGKFDWRRGSLVFLLIAVVCMVVTLFWPDGEVHVIDAASGCIVFCEDVTAGIHPLGRAWIDSDLNETVASPGIDVVTGLGRNTFTVTCTNRNCGIFDPARASFTLTIHPVVFFAVAYTRSMRMDIRDSREPMGRERRVPFPVPGPGCRGPVKRQSRRRPGATEG